GSHDNASAAKMRRVREILARRAPRLDMDGEMQGDTAWLEDMRRRMFPNTTLKGRANLFVMPNLDAANITYNMIILMIDVLAIGLSQTVTCEPAQMFSASASPIRVVHMTVMVVDEVQLLLLQRSGGKRRMHRHANAWPAV